MSEWTRRGVIRSVSASGVAAAGITAGAATAAGDGGMIGSAPEARSDAGSSRFPQYDAAHTGYAPDAAGPRTEPNARWEFDVDDPITTSPAVADGSVYVVGGETLHAVDVTRGGTRWTFSPSVPLDTSPCVVEETVYVTDADGTLYALDATDGAVDWSTPVGESPSTPVVTDGVVCVTGDSRLSLVSESGDEVDSVTLSGDAAGTPAVGDGVYVGTDDGTFYAFDVDRTGDGTSLEERWSVETVVERVPTATLADGTVYLTGPAPAEGDQGRVYAFDAATGERRWSFTGTPWVRGSAAVTDDSLFVGFDDGSVLAIDREAGTERWRFDANSSWSVLFWGSGVVGSPVVAGGTLYVGSEDDNLYALDATTGEERWRYATGDDVVGTPTVVDGVAYVGSTDGTLYALQGSERSTPADAPGDGDNDASGASDDGAESGSASRFAAAWSLLTSPPVLLGGMVIILLLITVSGGDDGSSDDDGSGSSGDAGGSGPSRPTTASTVEETFTADDVPEDLRDRRESLQNTVTEFAERNGLSRRTTSAVDVPVPESFDDADSARRGFDRVEDRVREWKDEWREQMDRRSRLESRVDRLGSRSEAAATPAIDVPDLDEFRRASGAREELKRREETVSRWEEAFEAYRDCRGTDPTLDRLTVPDDEFTVAEPTAFRGPGRALEAYEQRRERISAVDRLDDALGRLHETAEFDADAASAVTSDASDGVEAGPDPASLAERTERLVEVVASVAAFEGRPELPDADAFLRSIEETATEDGLPHAETLDEYERVVDGVETVVTFLDDVDRGHPSIDAEAWLDAANLALAEGYPKALDPVTARIERMGDRLWTHDNLQSYSWEEFESLVGSLYRSLGYDTRVTQGSADLGVDVWAERDGERIAVQVKQYARGNTVGRETLQKLASTLAKGDADGVVVVTTSTFARTAEEYAADFGPEIDLVDGDELLRLLDESELPPPAAGP